MLWICRTGKDSVYLDYYLKTSHIYLPWDGFALDLSGYKSITDFRNLVINEMQTKNRTSVSNWSGQLQMFVNEMQIDDYVLLPHERSRYYTLARIDGRYEFDKQNDKHLLHSRKIQVLIQKIPRDTFSQSIQYSLGAFRTIFRVKQENEIMLKISDLNRR